MCNIELFQKIWYMDLEEVYMKYRVINEFVTFYQGVNSTRAQMQHDTEIINYYDQSSFESDCNYEDITEVENIVLSDDFRVLNLGDVVISNSVQKATIVGNNNVGKILSLNFTKVIFKSEKLDKKYFLYLFNENKDIRRQKEKELQGSGTVLRIPLRALGEINVPVVPIEQQKKIGDIYIQSLKLKNQLNKSGALIEKFTNKILEERLRGDQ